VRRLGLENIRLMELTLLLLGVLFVLLLHISSTVLSYKISKQLWRLIDEKERMDDDFED
jgi:ABC-type uncharacterized transport system fused permease/ATPase subunit